MSEVVLDSSALLALLFREAGWRKVEAVLPDALMSSVNLAETAAKLMERGLGEAMAREAIDAIGVNVVAFSPEQAWNAARLRGPTRAAGLSLGDRACLALAAERDGVALTAERAWLATGLDRIETIR